MEVTLPVNRATIKLLDGVYDLLVESGVKMKIVIEDARPEHLARMRPFVKYERGRVTLSDASPLRVVCPMCRNKITLYTDGDFVAPDSCPKCASPVDAFVGSSDELREHVKILLGERSAVKVGKRASVGYNQDGELVYAVRAGDLWLIFRQVRQVSLTERDVSEILRGKVLVRGGVSLRFVPTPGLPPPQVKEVKKFGKSSAHVSLSKDFLGYYVALVPVIQPREEEEPDEEVVGTLTLEKISLSEKTVKALSSEARKLLGKAKSRARVMVVNLNGRKYLAKVSNPVLLRKALERKDLPVVKKGGKFYAYLDDEPIGEVQLVEEIE